MFKPSGDGHQKGNGNANRDSEVFQRRARLRVHCAGRRRGDVFVHVSAVAPGTPLLSEGMRVTFELGSDRKTGKSKAENVRPAGNDGR